MLYMQYMSRMGLWGEIEKHVRMNKSEQDPGIRNILKNKGIHGISA